MEKSSLDYQKEMNSLHEKAMELAEEGQDLFRQNKKDEAQIKYFSAFITEKAVADYLISIELEPSRSIVTMSAAWLAFNAKEYISAESLAKLVLEFNSDFYLTEQANDLMNELDNLK